MIDLEQYHLGSTAREIAAGVEGAVRRGELAPGEPLPPVRALARSLGVSPATVATALGALRRRGVIVSRERRGTTVSARPPVAIEPRLRAPAPGVRDVAHGNPDARLLPDLSAALHRLEVPLRLYREEPAIPELLALAAPDLFAPGVPTDDLCVVSGALDGVERALTAHLVPGDVVAVEDPCYVGQLYLVRALGLVPAPVRVDDRGPLPDALAAVLPRARAALLTPRAQNPTGAALDAERARALGDVLAASPDVVVIEDDHLGPVAGVPGATTVGRARRWAVVRSVAKALGPDLRVAVLAGDPETMGRVGGRHLVGPGWVSTILQRLVVALLSSPEVRRGLDNAEAAYSARRGALLDRLGRRGVAATGRSGFNVWVPVPEEGAVVTALLQAGWAVAAGEPYRLGSPPAIRVTTSTLAPGDADGFAACLSDVLRGGARTRGA